MKHPLPLLLAAVLLAASVPALHAGGVAMTVPPGDYLRQLGGSPLRDPAGVTHTDAEVKGRVAAIIFSVPDPSQGGRQRKWAAALADDPATRVPKTAALVLIEDMAQSGFAAMARDDMKRQYTPGSRPALLLDETGAITKHFGIPRDRTQILIYDKSGVLRHVETANPSPESAARVRKIVGTLLGE